MLKRILIVWLVANLLIPGIAALAAGGWYLGWGLVPGIVAELPLIMISNLLLPIALLTYWWPVPVEGIRDALGWVWNGWRAIITGVVAFAASLLLSKGVEAVVGESIPYQLPGGEGSLGPIEDPLALVGVLLALIVIVATTVAGEETMFRGLIQTQVGTRYGAWPGLLLGMVLFGLRHLPADLFYARAWNATPQMWVSRQLQLYSFALVLGLARRYGRSTYASAVAHALMFFANVFG